MIIMLIIKYTSLTTLYQFTHIQHVALRGIINSLREHRLIGIGIPFMNLRRSSYLHNYMIFVVKIRFKMSLKWHPFSSTIKAHRSKCQPMILDPIWLLRRSLHRSCLNSQTLGCEIWYCRKQQFWKCYRSARTCHIITSTNDIIDLPRPHTLSRWVIQVHFLGINS